MMPKFNSVYEGFNDIKIFEFIRDRNIMPVRDHFYIRDEIPYLSLVIQYRHSLLTKGGGFT